MNTREQRRNLFLYGSLLTGTPDRRLNKRMRRLLRRAQPAMIQARLYDLGRYPGVVASVLKTDRVYGKLITINDPRLLRYLDRYEDCYSADHAKSEFIRVSMPAYVLPSGKRVDCWVYIYNRGVSGKRRVAGGDYVRDKKARGKWLDPAAAAK
jgi:gamma-glutamylcyclotransferase (GGCT)/AIG2-like uncharacterized protein YtfP